jgi:molybdopterin synthase sulfur carrier subunit
MTVQLRFFASLREALGSGSAIELPVAGMTAGQLRDHLIGLSPAHAEALRRGRTLRCALNQQLCSEDTVVPDGAELAFFPPVTGG